MTGRPPTRPDSGLSAAVSDVVAAVLQCGGRVSPEFFGSERLGLVYRAFVICQLLEPLEGERHPSPERAAEIFCDYHLTGEGSEDWIQVYEHVGSVVAVAVTIGKRMCLPRRDLADIRAAALLHDVTKRADVERHGPLANSLGNVDLSLEVEMTRRGYPQRAVRAALNTGRADRRFDSEADRRLSIEQKGVIAGVVGLADTRTIGPHFSSLEEVQQEYLHKKTDLESVSFFVRDWLPYYQVVEMYLKAQAPGLNLDITDAEIYAETVFPEVFGSAPSADIRERYAYRSA